MFYSSEFNELRDANYLICLLCGYRTIREEGDYACRCPECGKSYHCERLKKRWLRELAYLETPTKCD